VSTACGEFYDTVQVVEVPAPFVNLGENTTLPYGDKFVPGFTTNAIPPLRFQWSATGSPLNCTDCPYPTATLLEPSAYSLTLTDAQGCTATDEVLAGVEDVRPIYAPNTFSPNGDGINDLFFLQGRGDFPIITLQVFDRWGGLVFSEKNLRVNDFRSGWNGRKKGKLQAPGAYLWRAEIEFAGGKTEQRSGELVLMR
jgi:gliding motility-associated-like protein